jgi:hypothetical protein
MNTNKSSKPDDCADFMKSEYETLLNFRQSLITLGENRLNFFLATVSGAAVGIGLINQVSTNKEIIYFVSGVILIGLFLLGLVTFVRTVERSIGIVVYTPRLKNIWFYRSMMTNHLLLQEHLFPKDSVLLDYLKWRRL